MLNISFRRLREVDNRLNPLIRKLLNNNSK